MGFVRREAPYGEPARGGKRSLYKIDDPFLRIWFRVIAPNRAALTAGTTASRGALLDEHWDHLVAQAWEDLCRRAIPRIAPRGTLGRLGPWRPPVRFWHGSAPEWDLVADAVEGPRTLLGEAWFSRKPVTSSALEQESARLEARPVPPAVAGRTVVRALFVPSVAPRTPRRFGSVHVAAVADLLRTGLPKSAR